MAERNVSLPQLDLFSPPAVQKSVEREYTVDYRPVTQLSEDAPIIFDITEQKHFLDLFNSQLYVKLRIVKKDGGAVADKQKVTPVNNILHSLFEKITVFIEGREVTGSNKDYPYKAYLSTLLSYDTSAKETQLQSQGFFKDDGDDMDKIANNTGAYHRAKLFAKSNTVELQSCLYEDIFMQQRFLPNNIKVSIKFDRTSHDFALLNLEPTTDYKVELQDVIFKARMVELYPEVQYSITKMMETRPALFPYTKREIRVENLQAGFTSGTFDNIFPSRLPTRVLVAIVNSEGYNGNKKKNPYAFKPCNLTRIALTVDNNTVATYTPTFGDVFGSGVAPAYLSLFDTFKQLGANFGNDLTLMDFAKSYTVYAFNIKPSYGSSYEPDHGHVRLSLTLSKPLTEASCLIMHSETPCLMEITGTRNVILK
jgi:hypothetical protein